MALYVGLGDSARGHRNTHTVLNYEGSGIVAVNVTADDIHKNVLNKGNFDVVFFPGGLSNEQARALSDKGRTWFANLWPRKRVRGVCAGAYLALSNTELNMSGSFVEQGYHGKSVGVMEMCLWHLLLTVLERSRHLEFSARVAAQDLLRQRTHDAVQEKPITGEDSNVKAYELHV